MNSRKKDMNYISTEKSIELDDDHNPLLDSKNSFKIDKKDSSNINNIKQLSIKQMISSSKKHQKKFYQIY